MDDRAPGRELRVTWNGLLGRCGEQALEGIQAARVVKAVCRLPGELGVTVGATRRPGIASGGRHLVVLGAPFGGPGGKELRRLRLGPAKLGLEHLPKRPVEAVGALAEGNEEGG